MTYTLLLPSIGNAPAEHVPPVEGELNLSFVGQLFDLMLRDPGQQRPTCVFSGMLQLAAQAHSEDMAKRNYFSHVSPDGIWPNQRVREAGYHLPDDWPSDNNYCESIAGGQQTPEDAWQAWLHSDSHRVHVLGLSPFFAAQVKVGIGYYHLGGGQSVYEHYWTVISAPVEAA